MTYLIDTILDVVFWFITAAINLLPTYTPPSGSSLQSLINALATFNNFFPAVELMECMIAYFAFCGVVMVVKPILSVAQLR